MGACCSPRELVARARPFFFRLLLAPLILPFGAPLQIAAVVVEWWLLSLARRVAALERPSWSEA